MDLTKPGVALTDVILGLFRVNSLLLMRGDRLVADLGLTSARWQVLGAIVYADRPEPVAWLARDLGSNRQNVQRIVNDLHREGFVEFQTNPHHRRAQLVVLTDKGRAAFDRAMQLWIPWANSLAEGHSLKDIGTMAAFVNALRRKLEDGHNADDE
ncbi:MAG: MarR family winged helix-turn-helix transcriptional regulator [Roseiarcus sp.]|jgi:DNA-binding MarR family transcriptional regulator